MLGVRPDRSDHQVVPTVVAAVVHSAVGHTQAGVLGCVYRQTIDARDVASGIKNVGHEGSSVHENMSSWRWNTEMLTRTAAVAKVRI